MIVDTEQGKFDLDTREGADGFLAACSGKAVSANAQKLLDESDPEAHRVSTAVFLGALATRHPQRSSRGSR